MDDEAIKAVPQMKDNGRFAQLEVKAPRAGVITAQNITEGKFVESSQSLYTIADTSNVWVWCDLYERDLGPLHERLAKGDKPQASVKVTAFADTFPGAVDLLDSAVNETTRTVKVRVQVKNEQGKLRPGMFAAVDIPLTEGKKVALVPRQAVLSDEGPDLRLRPLEGRPVAAPGCECRQATRARWWRSSAGCRPGTRSSPAAGSCSRATSCGPRWARAARTEPSPHMDYPTGPQ